MVEPVILNLNQENILLVQAMSHYQLRLHSSGTSHRAHDISTHHSKRILF